MSDMMTHEEIEALVRGEQGEPDSLPNDIEQNIAAPSDDQTPAASGALEATAAGEPAEHEELLSDEERDILGELGNICMGTAATTMYTLLGKRVSITTPRVLLRTEEEMTKDHQTPFVAVSVSYTEGLVGDNLLMMKESDAAVITDLLMGGEGIVQGDIVLEEIHLSAISELMNQMVGSSATSMANVLHIPINISTPNAKLVNILETTISDMFAEAKVIIKISFDMEIEGLLKSEIMQIMPLNFGRQLVERVAIASKVEMPVEPAKPSQAAAPVPPAAEAAPAKAPSAAAPLPDYAAPASAPIPQGYAAPNTPPVQETSQFTAPSPQGAPRMDVKTVQFQSFDSPNYEQDAFSDNINIIMDVPLQVSVELGKSRKSIRDILDFGMGSIIVLDKLAGELVDVLVNGKLIARGEVVVIDESYGVRITDIVTPEKRMASMR